MPQETGGSALPLDSSGACQRLVLAYACQQDSIDDPKEIGSIAHAMVAWGCSNPDVLENERAIADLLSRQASPFAFDAEALRVSPQGSLCMDRRPVARQRGLR